MAPRRFFKFSTLTSIILGLSTLCPNITSSTATGIECFKCVSVNGSNPACEDPFHNNRSSSFLEKPCMGGRKNRDGLFPASACIKLSGRYTDGSGTIMVRGCALDSGTLTTDTEIIRMSHCGSFYYDDKYVRGCVQSCDEVDGCNSSTGLTASQKFTTIVVSVALIKTWISIK